MEPPPNPHAVHNPRKQEGLLWKKARGRSAVSLIHKPWALRWFTFENGILSYYKASGLSGNRSLRSSMSRSPKQNVIRAANDSLKLQGEIHVNPEHAIVNEEKPENDQTKKFVFCISNCQNEDGQYETVYLAAPTKEDMTRWKNVLMQRNLQQTGVGLQAPMGEPVELKRAVSRTAPKISHFYHVHERLGQGGFSVVYRGSDIKTGEIFALKQIQKNVFERNTERTEEECKVLASLNHPGIVELREVVRTEQYFVIVMELLEGGDLFERLVAKKKYNEFDAKYIAVHILDAIRYLHQNDIVHRDIKPENIIFDKKGDPAMLKITDFGFATMYDKKKTRLTATCGTPEYVAPEVLEENPYDEKVDLWSCGVVFYILLCGFPPFYGETQQVLFDRICKAKYHFVRPYWDVVSKEAKDLIRNLLELNPEKRLTAQEALEHPWFSDVVEGSDKHPMERPFPSESADLKQVLHELRRYNAFRKLKKGVHAIVAVNKLRTAINPNPSRVSFQTAAQKRWQT